MIYRISINLRTIFNTKLKQGCVVSDYAMNLELSRIYDDGVEYWAMSVMLIEFEWVLYCERYLGWCYLYIRDGPLQFLISAVIR